MVNNLVAGKLSPDFVPYFASANLTALKKKSGGRRPVAVLEVIRRLASKCCAFEIAPRVADYLEPLQLGVGVKGGVETAIHGVRVFVESPHIPSEQKYIYKSDFTNAFNLIDRSQAFAQFGQNFPEISAYMSQCMLHRTFCFSQTLRC